MTSWDARVAACGDERGGAGAGPLPVAVVVSRYNSTITDALLRGAMAEYERRWGTCEAVAVFDVPGSFELPVAVQAAARSGRYAAVVALGCLVRGQTRHDRYLAAAVIRTLAQIAVQTGVPVGCGVLTVETLEQARERAGGRLGNRGQQAMGAALDAAAAVKAIVAGAPGWLLPPGRDLPDKARPAEGTSAHPAVVRP